MMAQTLIFLPLVTLVATAAFIDTRSRRIPNWLTLSVAVAGLTTNTMPLAPVGATSAWAGLGAGFVLTFFMFAIGAMGGGDVKLVSAIGAWVGPVGVLHVFCAAAILGMLLALWQAARSGKLASLCRGTALVVINATRGDLTAPTEPAQSPDKPDRSRLPYAVPLLGALLVTLWMQTAR